MALTPAFSITSTSITDDGSETNLQDDTVYGGSEFARAAVAIALRAVKVDEDLSETTLTITDYDVETDADFVVTNTTDGWQKYYFSIIPEYNSGTTYQDNYVVYYASTERYYRARASAAPFSAVVPTNTTNWLVVTHQDIIDAIDTSTEADNVVTQVVQTVLTFATRQCLDDVVIDVASGGCCDDCDETKLRIKRDKLFDLVYGMQVASSRQLYLKGEIFAREAENYCDNCCD